MRAISRIPTIKKKILPILKRHDVKRAAIFGSFARGEAKANSDVDLLIEYKSKDKSLFDLVDLKSELELTLRTGACIWTEAKVSGVE